MLSSLNHKTSISYSTAVWQQLKCYYNDSYSFCRVSFIQNKGGYRDPTRKAIIKGKQPRDKKPKYLNQFELQKLLADLTLEQEVSWDWFILLVAKTGMRFSEALALTPKDFNLSHQILSISKTWNYKGNGGFSPTKNSSSVRKIQLDWQTVIQFAGLLKGLPEDQPIFVKNTVYNSKTKISISL